MTQENSTINSQLRHPETLSLIPKTVIQSGGKRREREVFKIGEYPNLK